jgi:hypothetical protein
MYYDGHFFFCVRSDLVEAIFERILRITAVYRAIGPAIPTSAC